MRISDWSSDVCSSDLGSGAQILGPFEVGRCARIGANAVVTKEVPEGATIVGIPGRAVQTTRPAQSAAAPFVASGTPVGNIPDPIARALDGQNGRASCREGVCQYV